jgi:hypothetical protein
MRFGLQFGVSAKKMDVFARFNLCLDTFSYIANALHFKTNIFMGTKIKHVLMYMNLTNINTFKTLKKHYALNLM